MISNFTLIINTCSNTNIGRFKLLLCSLLCKINFKFINNDIELYKNFFNKIEKELCYGNNLNNMNLSEIIDYINKKCNMSELDKFFIPTYQFLNKKIDIILTIDKTRIKNMKEKICKNFLSRNLDLATIEEKEKLINYTIDTNYTDNSDNTDNIILIFKEFIGYINNYINYKIIIPDLHTELTPLRNISIENANTKYLTFTDDDDIHMDLFSLSVIIDKCNTLSPFLFIIFPILIYMRENNKWNLEKTYLKNSNWSKIFNTDNLKKLHVSEPVNLYNYEDSVFTKYILNSNKKHNIYIGYFDDYDKKIWSNKNYNFANKFVKFDNSQMMHFWINPSCRISEYPGPLKAVDFFDELLTGKLYQTNNEKYIFNIFDLGKNINDINRKIAKNNIIRKPFNLNIHIYAPNTVIKYTIIENNIKNIKYAYIDSLSKHKFILNKYTGKINIYNRNIDYNIWNSYIQTKPMYESYIKSIILICIVCVICISMLLVIIFKTSRLSIFHFSSIVKSTDIGALCIKRTDN